MIIIGAKGFATEILEILLENNINDVAFYDDVNVDMPNLLYNKFPVIKNEIEFKNYQEKINNSDFCLGLGNPFLRYKLYNKFTIDNSNVLKSVISKKATIGKYIKEIKNGANILPNVSISNNVSIGLACLIYYNCVITHDCIIGDFVELSPNVILLGNVTVGSFTHIGANSTILPNITIGKNVIIAAGSVVTKDVPDNCMVAGVPANIKKELRTIDI